MANNTAATDITGTMSTPVARHSELADATQLNTGLFYLLSLPLLFYYYFGEQRVYTGFVYVAALAVWINSVIASGLVRRVQLYIVASLLVLMAICIYTFSGFAPSMLALRLNFGVFILTLAYSAIPLPPINGIATLLSVWTLAEYLLIRLMPTLIYVLPNYDGSFSISQTAGIFGGVHSFGGNRSVTAVILLALFIFLERTQPKRRWRYLPLVACLLCESGTAYALIFVYLLMKYVKRVFPLIVVLTVLAILLYYQSDDVFLIGKFNWVYLVFLWNYKAAQIMDYWSKSSGWTTLLFGMGSKSFSTVSGEVARYGASYGDFIFLDFFARFGIVGVTILVALAKKFSSKATNVPIWFLVVGTLHYHVLFSGPGQVIGAYLFVAGARAFPRAVPQTAVAAQPVLLPST